MTYHFPNGHSFKFTKKLKKSYVSNDEENMAKKALFAMLSQWFLTILKIFKGFFCRDRADLEADENILRRDYKN